MIKPIKNKNIAREQNCFEKQKEYVNEADFIHQLHGTGMAFKLHQGGVDEVGGFFFNSYTF